jgi:hypothetical protein
MQVTMGEANVTVSDWALMEPLTPFKKDLLRAGVRNELVDDYPRTVLAALSGETVRNWGRSGTHSHVGQMSNPRAASSQASTMCPSGAVGSAEGHPPQICDGLALPQRPHHHHNRRQLPPTPPNRRHPT